MVSTLQAERLDIGYPGVRVGSGLDVSLQTGEVVCLLGPNGCGKTTLFKTLLGLIPSQGGSVLLNGTPLGQLDRPAIARQLAYVPQAHAAVFPYTVRDMVVMGRTAHRGLFSGPNAGDRARAEAALDQLGIAELADRDYTRISGGQRQLALIARALSQDAALIVMDEPTASLDFGNQMRLLSAVRLLAETGIGIILSTHNPDHAFAIATRVHLLAHGHTQAVGAPADVLTAEALTHTYGVPIAVEHLSSGHRVCVPAQPGAAG